MSDDANDLMYAEALRMHARGRPGKVAIEATKPLTTQRDLTLAYSPGVAAPCLEIHRDPALVYKYTAMGNTVAVISNGTAVLGLGNIGALAAKPVMEGKSVLFKRFADIDGMNVEVHTQDVDEFVNCVRFIGNSYGGVNLEDIKAPECFVIEQRLKELLDVPVFHDDQHGTAIITAAGLINALDLTGRRIEDCRMVVNGAGAASIACVELFKRMGMPGDHVVMCDSKGVIYQGRTEGMNQWKSAHAAKTDARTLADAMKGADCFVGLSVKGAVTKDMVASMAPNPLVFAMANPDPEITPEEVAEVRSDVIMATGRSDYPNQINNVLGFPFIFRGALDVRAREITEDMKIAAAEALAQLAREDVPDEVDAAYSDRHLSYGPEYLIPTPFDPRLITAVPVAVAKAAMKGGVARHPIEDFEAYEKNLRARLSSTAAALQFILDEVRHAPKKVVFAEGEEEKSIRAALGFHNAGYGEAVLVGREERVEAQLKKLGLSLPDGVEVHNARTSTRNAAYTAFLYKRLQRKGALERDCQRLVNQDRNVFAACMVANGDADGMVTGLTRNYHAVLDSIERAIGPADGAQVFGLSLVMSHQRTIYIADTAVRPSPTAEELACCAEQAAAAVRRFGQEPRVALVSFANFGHPDIPKAEVVREAVELLDQRGVDFEYDGEMSVDTALNDAARARYPFCRLSASANVLILPGLHSADVSAKLLHELGGHTVIGPLLIGLAKPVQIVQAGATASEMVTMAALAAHEAGL